MTTMTMILLRRWGEPYSEKHHEALERRNPCYRTVGITGKLMKTIIVLENADTCQVYASAR
jgi:hypothetical protein